MTTLSELTDRTLELLGKSIAGQIPRTPRQVVMAALQEAMAESHEVLINQAHVKRDKAFEESVAILDQIEYSSDGFVKRYPYSDEYKKALDYIKNYRYSENG